MVGDEVARTAFAPLETEVQDGLVVAHFHVNVTPLQELSLGTRPHASGCHKGHIDRQQLPDHPSA